MAGLHYDSGAPPHMFTAAKLLILRLTTRSSHDKCPKLGTAGRCPSVMAIRTAEKAESCRSPSVDRCDITAGDLELDFVQEATWKQVPSTRPNKETASQAMPPDGWRRPVAAAHAMSATPAGSSRHALTNSGLVCGASICGGMEAVLGRAKL